MKESLQNTLGVAWLILFWPVLLGGIAGIAFRSIVPLMIVFTLLIVAELIISGNIVSTLYD